MTAYELAYKIYDMGLPTAIREGDWWFAVLECFHILALTIVVGTVVAVDLRLLGLAARRVPVTTYCADILPVTWGAFAIAVVTGSLLFSSSAPKYFLNFSFRMKMLLLICAGLNMLYFHVVTWRTVEQWNLQDPPPRAARIAAGLSILIWLGIICFGRWNGFTLGALPPRP